MTPSYCERVCREQLPTELICRELKLRMATKLAKTRSCKTIGQPSNSAVIGLKLPKQSLKLY